MAFQQHDFELLSVLDAEAVMAGVPGDIVSLWMEKEQLNALGTAIEQLVEQLREVGLVRDRKAGKQRLYGLDARELRPVHEWTGGFERFWNESFDRLDEYVQDLKQARQEE